MLPSYIEDDVKAQITNGNELHDQYCSVFMSHLPFFDEGLNLWGGSMIVPVRDLVPLVGYDIQP